MRVKLVFDHWNRHGKPLGDEGPELALRLSAGDFHSGTIWNGTIDLSVKDAGELFEAFKTHRAVPVFWLAVP